MENRVDENGFIIEPEELNTEYESSFFLMLTMDVLKDDNLSDFQKLLFTAITGLCRQKGYCWASNSYFEKLFKKGNTQVSTGISKLVELGYLKRELIYKRKEDKNGNIITTKQIAFRKLYVVLNNDDKNTGIPENQNTGIPENQKEIDNPIIDNLTSNNLSKDKLIEDSEPNPEGENNFNINNLEDKNGTVGIDVFSGDEKEEVPKTPAAKSPRKKGGLAPLYDMVTERYPETLYPTLNQALKGYLKAHLGIRRIPSIDKWKEMLEQLNIYSSIQLAGADGYKFMESRALEIVQKAMNGKNGAPFTEFDDMYNNNSELMEPTFNLNRDFTKGY